MEGLELVFWHWWVLAILLLGVEMIAPGFFLLWFSIAGFIVGSVVFFYPGISTEIQLLFFSILSISSIFVWHRFGIQSDVVSDQPLLNKRNYQYVGRTFYLYEQIENGRGKIKVDDSLWTVIGPDSPVDTKVKVTAVNGTLLDVELVKEE